MRKKPKTGEGRGNNRRQSQPGRDVGGAKHETGRNGQNDKRHGRERTEAGAAKEGNKESEQNKIKISAGLVSGGTCILELARKSEVSDSTNSMIWSFHEITEKGVIRTMKKLFCRKVMRTQMSGTKRHRRRECTQNACGQRSAQDYNKKNGGAIKDIRCKCK
ncbi:hypothetical protein TNCV_3724261 [Trichonephila clavipes]|nr:hypothetical protein TNCV_3724261 [Trichonephila clavipes]